MNGYTERRITLRADGTQALNKLWTILTPASIAEERSMRSKVLMAELVTIKMAAVYGVTTPVGGY
jgi:hypothetical protein